MTRYKYIYRDFCNVFTTFAECTIIVTWYNVSFFLRIYPFKNATWSTKGLHSLQLHSSPFQVFILLLKLERVSDCFMSLGSACHNLPPPPETLSSLSHNSRGGSRGCNGCASTRQSCKEITEGKLPIIFCCKIF